MIIKDCFARLFFFLGGGCCCCFGRDEKGRSLVDLIARGSLERSSRPNKVDVSAGVCHVTNVFVLADCFALLVSHLDLFTAETGHLSPARQPF